MINIQAQMKELFGNSCLAYCYAYISCKHKYAGEPTPQMLTSEVLHGWYAGYITDTGYVSKPVEYWNGMQSSKFGRIKDIVKVPIKALSELPTEGSWIVKYKKSVTEDSWIVEYKKSVTDEASHFVVATRSQVIFDPSGKSNTVRIGVPVSYRKLVWV